LGDRADPKSFPKHFRPGRGSGEQAEISVSMEQTLVRGQKNSLIVEDSANRAVTKFATRPRQPPFPQKYALK